MATVCLVECLTALLFWDCTCLLRCVNHSQKFGNDIAWCRVISQFMPVEIVNSWNIKEKDYFMRVYVNYWCPYLTKLQIYLPKYILKRFIEWLSDRLIYSPHTSFLFCHFYDKCLLADYVEVPSCYQMVSTSNWTGVLRSWRCDVTSFFLRGMFSENSYPIHFQQRNVLSANKDINVSTNVKLSQRFGTFKSMAVTSMWIKVKLF